MSTFTKPLVYRTTGKRRDGRAVYALAAPFSYELGFRGSNIAVSVPEGFETDFASIPGFADDWFGFDPVDGLVKNAAVIHDYLYSNHDVIDPLMIAVSMFTDKDIRLSPRAFSDRIFFEAMGIQLPKGFPGVVQNVRRHIVFFSVRLFGGRPFARFSNINPESKT